MLILFSSSTLLSAQALKGKVTDEKNTPLAGVTLRWLHTRVTTSTNDQGEFDIKTPEGIENKLIASLAGYQPDTVPITSQKDVHIKLTPSNQLSEVIVKGPPKGQYISSLYPIKTEVITATELKKGACCDLAGCFNTNASVQPSTTNVVTNAQELRILGLSGIYNQVLLDGFPLIQGLSYTYGISQIPGPLVDNIYVAKGANSVLQGWESISGQINVLTKEPDKADKYFLSAYTNTFWEKQFNGYYTYSKNRWSDLLALHTVQPASRTDGDHDGFLDLPLVTRYEVYNKLKYGNESDFGWTTHIGIRYTHENRIGGQTTFNPATGKGKTDAYGQTVDIDQPELTTKTAYRFDESKRLVLTNSAQYQKQQSWYGLTRYNAHQTLVNVTLQYEWKYQDESNLKTGLSYRHFNLDEDIAFSQNPLNHTYAGQYQKQENIPGLFAENTLYFGQDKFTWITGARLDHHNQFGFIFTPRTLLKYSPAPKTSIRASIGYGWRTASIFSENSSLLASQRDILFNGTLNPEKAINTGINFIQNFSTTNLEGYFSADYYFTRFFNQIFPDYNTDPTKAYIGNFTGLSVSNGLQAELGLTFFHRLDLKTAYNYLDVHRKINGQNQMLPFNPRYTILNTLSYKPLTGKWHIDANIHSYGEQQLPNTSTNPPPYQRPDHSTPYTVVNAQATYTFKKIEVYAGCENIFDFRQQKPIIGWQDPFGPYFDTSSAWGPTRGREGYIGVRLSITKN